MITRLEVSNFKSFVKPTVFDFTTTDPELKSFEGKLEAHTHHCYYHAPTDQYILRAAVFYGANASGKSNIIKLFDLLGDLLNHRDDVNTIFNRPDASYFSKQLGKSQPLEIGLSFIIPIRKPPSAIGENCTGTESPEYTYFLRIGAIDPEKPNLVGILQEKLTARTGATNGPETIYDIVFVPETDGCVMQQENLRESRPNYLGYMLEDWSGQQLFLKLASAKNVAVLQPIFAYVKTMIHPVNSETRLASIRWLLSIMEPTEQPRSERAFVQAFIDRLELGLDEIMLKTHDAADHDKHIVFQRLMGNELEANPNRLMFKQIAVDKPFELWELSDGTLRILELLPQFYALSKTARSFIIDELDSHLHTKLFTSLVNYVLDETFSQIIFTAHDTNLMDNQYLRPDEVHYLNRNPFGGESHTNRLSRREIARYNRWDQHYKEGYMGAVPIIILYEMELYDKILI
jgi:AAA15 family ATPase/GTPase